MCIFCRIVSGEIPSRKVYEDDFFLAFLDISQASKGHTLVVPKKHFSSLFDLDRETSEKLFPVIRKVAIAIKKATGCDGLNIINNTGKAAGQTVDHFHVHILPRYASSHDTDNVRIVFETNRFSDPELEELAEKIKSKASEIHE